MDSLGARLSLLLMIMFINFSISTGSTKLSNETFTFAHTHSFFNVEPDWPLSLVREVSFEFRTEHPQGLLLYHGIKNMPLNSIYELYLMLDNGQVKIIHIFYRDGRDVESFSVGKALNTDKWHGVHLHINPQTGNLTIEVDHVEEILQLQSLKDQPSYGLSQTQTHSFLYFGGMDNYNPVWNQQYNYVRFVGCMKEVKFSHSNEPLHPVKLGNHSQLEHGCLDQCKKQDMCQNKGRCINHYTSTSCDCFGTNNENEICGSSNLTVITLRGNSFLTYHVFDWRDKVHSEPARISITFKTILSESVLFYGAGKHPVTNYLIMNLINGRLLFEINFGDGPLTAILGSRLDDEVWHNVTMVRHGTKVIIHLDRTAKELNVTGHHHHLHFDPEVYIGGLSPRILGHHTRKMFVGCLRQVYLNDQNILFSLKDNKEKTVRHHGVIPVEYGCKVLDVVPITFSAIGGYIVVNQSYNADNNQRLQLSLEFKTSKDYAYLASGKLKSGNKDGFWQVALQKGSIFFMIVPDQQEPQTHWVLTEGTNLLDNIWHQVDVLYDKGSIKLTVDFDQTSEGQFSTSLTFVGDALIATNTSEIKTGFIGCLRDIYVNDMFLDPRDFENKAEIHGKVSFDNCRFVDPCANPRACEHGGKCFVEHGKKGCDCNGTGYTGETCHFASYKRTCEELYLLGYRISGVYKIDIDRNGPMPPAHVFCEMQQHGIHAIATRVENNLPKEMVVRKPGMEGFYVNITYRDFTPEMLQSLIDQSKHCSQHFKYECHYTPLGLYTYTWMDSSFGHTILHVGNAAPGYCQCGVNRTCANPTQLCNCDSWDRPWRTDEGTYTNPEDLGITRIYILQPSTMDQAAQARIHLGPLECVETDTQLYVITFKTKHSYLEVPGWRNGDMAFSFRTSNNRAVLLYQASAYTDHGYFRVLLTSDHELSFEFTVNGVPQSVKVKSRRPLNSGEWQQVWVDHDTHHMRFTINLDSVMIDLADEEVGPFEGPMFIGAVPGQFAKDSPIKQGFIGCFRGLVINNAVVDVYQYLTRRAADIATGCKPSCLPNPCQNHAICHEFWGTYQCECRNPAAHSGVNCETNINENSLTFLTAGSYYHNKTEGNLEVSLLRSNFLISFRTYEKNALILYAFDHFNNFIQLHVANGNRVVFTYNTGRKIVDGFVESKSVSEGSPTQVIIERTNEMTKLTVNKIPTPAIIRHPMLFLDEYHQYPWLENKNKELASPARGSFGTVPHNQMFIGGVSKDGMVSLIPGFVGCIQGLKIGSHLFDLQQAAKSPEAHGDILSNCKMLCDLYPCQHGGLCIEDWKNNHTSCDCSMTSYIGETCNKEYSGSFDGKSLVQYSFRMETPWPETIIIHLAFSSKDNRDIKRTLLTVHFAHSSNYILIALNPNGTLIVEENQATKKVIFNAASKKGSLLDGYRHWLRYTRMDANSHFLELDVEKHVATTYASDKSVSTGLDNFVYLGGNIKGSPFTEYANFKGCISNVDILIDNVHMNPFKTAFGYEEGVSILDKVKVQGDVIEDRCADFAVGIFGAETVSPPMPPEMVSEKWFFDPPVMVPYSTKSEHVAVKELKELTISTGRVALVMAILLIIVLMAIALYIWKSQRKHELLQFEEETRFFYSKRQNYPVKAVSFNDTKQFTEVENPHLHPTPELIDLRTKSYIAKPKDQLLNFKDPEYSPNYNRDRDTSDALTMSPIRPSSSQELEWDPAADTDDLITTTLENDTLGESEDTENDEIEDKAGLLNKEDEEDEEDETDYSRPIHFYNSPNGPFTAPLASTSEVTINRLSESFA